MRMKPPYLRANRPPICSSPRQLLAPLDDRRDVDDLVRLGPFAVRGDQLDAVERAVVLTADHSDEGELCQVEEAVAQLDPFAPARATPAEGLPHQRRRCALSRSEPAAAPPH